MKGWDTPGSATICPWICESLGDGEAHFSHKHESLIFCALQLIILVPAIIPFIFVILEPPNSALVEHLQAMQLREYRPEMRDITQTLLLVNEDYLGRTALLVH